MPPRARVDSSTSEPRRPPPARDDGARPLARLDSDAGGASREAEPPVTAAVVVRETMLGVVICFAQIPESIAFALMAHVRPPVALHSAWIVGLICGLFGGRPGMVNGATGAFAAVIATFLPAPSAPGANSAAIELLFPSVMCGGVLMLVVWLLRLDRFVTMLPVPVMIGFCNGLAIVIGRSQLHAFHAPVCEAADAAPPPPPPALGALENRGTKVLTETCTASGWREGPELGFMLLIMFVAMGTMEGFPKIQRPPKPRTTVLLPPYYLLKILFQLPSSLLSIVAALLIEMLVVRPLGYRTETIGDINEFTSADALPVPFFLNDEYGLSKLNMASLPTIFLQGVLLCAVGSIESLMTAEVVSSFTKSTHHSGMVVAAMAVGNVVSGFLGGMGGNAMIGLSTIACLNGGRRRIAPVVTALAIFVCVAAAYPVLNYIPIAALVGIMMIVVLHTFKWSSVPMLVAACLPMVAREAATLQLPFFRLNMHRKVERMDVGIAWAVTVVTFTTNLVYAVGFGVALSCARFAWQSAAHIAVRHYYRAARRGEAGARVKVYEVDGPLFFASAMPFIKQLTVEDDPETVEVIFTQGELFDYTALDALNTLSKQYAAAKKRVIFRRLTAKSVSAIKKAAHLLQDVEYDAVIDDAESERNPSPMAARAGATDLGNGFVSAGPVAFSGRGWRDM